LIILGLWIGLGLVYKYSIVIPQFKKITFGELTSLPIGQFDDKLSFSQVWTGQLAD